MLNIKIDSRKVIPGDTFVAIKGNTVDGHDFINQAIENGATKIIASHGNYLVETIITENPEEYIKDYLVKEYKTILDSMTFIGVTGTNGKTTTCYLTYQLLNLLGRKTAYIGTIGFYLDKLVRELPNTTPNIVDLYSLILEAKDNGYDTIVMEVSSHALDLKRVAGINFKIAAFTNLTQDHLDYHQTMENYLNAKKLILNQVSGTMISNIDDNYGLAFKTNHFKTYGFKESDYQIISYDNNNIGTEIIFKYNNQNYTINNKLRGKFNVYNFITLISIAHELGYSLEDILNNSLSITPPKGRCQIIPVKQGEAVIDYAHTPDAVEKIISTFNEHKNGKIITVIGCGGDRDPKKRPIMGSIATNNSDYVIFTSDNPRTEDPNTILNNIISGVTKDNYEIEPDRKKAIVKALNLINKNDIVLLLGKGHEDYQIIGKEKIHLDDSEEVYNYLNSLKQD